MLSEAVETIRALFDGGYVNYAGQHFRVDSAKLWDVPDPPPRIALAASGRQSGELAAQIADALIAVEPSPGLVGTFDGAGEQSKPCIGQVPISYDPDRDAAIERAHEQFRWFGDGWKVNAEPPGPTAFDAASQFVTKDDVASAISCGPDLDAHVKAISEFVDAGFTHVGIVQIGGAAQDGFLDWAETELLPALHGR